MVPWGTPSLPLSTVLVSRISLVFSIVFSLWFGLLLVNRVRVLANKTRCDVVMSFIIESVTRSLLSLMFSSLLSMLFSLLTLSTYKRRNTISYLEAGPFRELRPKRPVLNWIYKRIEQVNNNHE